MTKKKIKDSLMEQLKNQGKTADFYSDLVNDYMSYWEIKKQLIDDIKTEGLRYTFTNGNGINTEKPNESVKNLPGYTSAMLKILHDLGLQDPTRQPDDEDDYL